jgi:hypothetical protein
MGSLGSAGCSLLRAEGFSCGLDVLYGGLFAFCDLKEEEKCSCNKFFSFLDIKTLDPDSFEMLDPDPFQQHWFSSKLYFRTGYLLRNKMLHETSEFLS